MISFPNAKINLGLNVVRKREDGYHDIESCFYPIPWKEALEIIPAKRFEFISYGLDIPGNHSSNLCIKAYELLRRAFGIDPVKIILLKKIPVGAGLGGGSADGAFVLKMLDKHFKLRLSTSQLMNYASQIGSDCPFFIKNESAIASGRGEILEPIELNLAGKFLAIKNPGIYIATKEAYAGAMPQTPKQSISEVLNKPLAQWSELLTNDFEKSIFASHPKIKAMKKQLYQCGAAYAALTGSGSTVYGLFEREPDLPDWKVLQL